MYIKKLQKRGKLYAKKKVKLLKPYYAWKDKNIHKSIEEGKETILLYPTSKEEIKLLYNFIKSGKTAIFDGFLITINTKIN